MKLPMTQALSSISTVLNTSAVSIRYIVAMPHPQTHLFEVTLTLENWSADVLDLKFPVWTPGSDLVREYVRHLQRFAAMDVKGKHIK